MTKRVSFTIWDEEGKLCPNDCTLEDFTFIRACALLQDFVAHMEKHNVKLVEEFWLTPGGKYSVRTSALECCFSGLLIDAHARPIIGRLLLHPRSEEGSSCTSAPGVVIVTFGPDRVIPSHSWLDGPVSEHIVVR
jgi:hypothetical protein